MIKFNEHLRVCRYDTMISARLDEAENGTINTHNGEISDATAYAIVTCWHMDGTTPLDKLFRGEAVDRTELYNDIQRLAVQTFPKYPRELQWLLSWAMCHD